MAQSDEIWFEEGFYEKYNLFLEQINYYWKRKATETLRYAYTCSSSMYTCFMHVYTYTCMSTLTRVLETMKGKFSAFKLTLERIPHHLRATLNPYFSTI